MTFDDVLMKANLHFIKNRNSRLCVKNHQLDIDSVDTLKVSQVSAADKFQNQDMMTNRACRWISHIYMCVTM